MLVIFSRAPWRFSGFCTPCLNFWTSYIGIALWCASVGQPCTTTSARQSFIIHFAINGVYTKPKKNMQGISDDKISFRIFPHRCLWGEIVILLFLILPIIRFLKLLRYFAAWRLNRCGLGGRMDDGTNVDTHLPKSFIQFPSTCHSAAKDFRESRM